MKYIFLLCAGVTLLSSCNTVDQVEFKSDVEQGVFLACDGTSAWTRTYRVNGVEVGREDCDCPGIVTPYGTLTGRYTQEVMYSCN
jgi:hypothetical protein